MVSFLEYLQMYKKHEFISQVFQYIPVINTQEAEAGKL
jgi:hypothetical protein